MDNNEFRNKIDFEKIIFILYVISLPFYRFDSMLSKYFFTAGNSISVLFHILGVVIIFINFKRKKYEFSKLLRYTIFMILFLNFTALIMSAVLYYKVGTWVGRNTYIETCIYAIYDLQIIMAFWYNYQSIKKYGLKIVEKCFNFIIIYITLIGYLQILIITKNNSFVCKFYDLINIFSLNKSSQDVINYQRIPLTTFEPSTAGVFLGVIIIPFLFAKYITTKKKLNIFLFILIIPIIYFTHSSTAYITILIVFIFFTCNYLKYEYKTQVHKMIMLVSVVISIILLGIFIKINSSIKQDNGNFTKQVEYLTFQKVNDSENLSTIHRKTTIHNNIEVFKKYPILGVGNGNQGFFYRENFPDWAYISVESRNALSGESGFIGPGALLSGYLSAHGMVGIVLLIYFIYISYRNIKLLNNLNKLFSNFYIISMIGIIISSVISINIFGVYFIMFTLSIAFDSQKLKNSKLSI